MSGDGERKNKMRPLDQNSNNIELGVIGINNEKKREKTLFSDNKLPAGSNKNLNHISNQTGQQRELPPSESMLDLNLKGVNLKLNEKLPFVMVPKDKKKK